MKQFKSSFFFSAILLSLAFSASEVSAQGFGGGPVVVYNQRDGAGNSQVFDVGEFRNDRGQLGNLRNDTAVSVFVEVNYRVRFCDSENRGGTGRCEEFGPGYHNLRYPNIASYIRVTGPGGGWTGGGGVGGVGGRGVTVFEDRDFRGGSQTFGPGRYLNNAGQLGSLRNDEASSIIVDRGFRARLCESEGTGNGSGRCEEYSEGRFNLRYNDEVSFIQVQRIGGSWGGGGWGGGGGGGFGGSNRLVIVYSDPDQGGDQQGYDVGTYRNDLRTLGNIKNDDAGSVFVPRGYRVRICDSEGGGRGAGRCEEYGSGTRNLRYNDRMSYIRVWRGN